MTAQAFDFPPNTTEPGVPIPVLGPLGEGTLPPPSLPVTAESVRRHLEAASAGAKQLAAGFIADAERLARDAAELEDLAAVAPGIREEARHIALELARRVDTMRQIMSKTGA